MLNKAYLSQHFELRTPATSSQIHDAETKIGLSFPKEYVDLLQITNGLNSMGCLALHEIEILPERNVDYEVQKYLPGYFMIGDDSGGQAILINSSGEVFEVGMGVMNPKFLERSADSLTDLLVNLKGLTLGER
ncbi:MULTISPECIES: SMI1/KNR4 family protein [Burkholderia]|uniref:SMI1/KNR4 family protein n=1 Tax=Burkholderia sola TaxID=2843302 RepID=A0ABV2CI82_9BURK|nr:MULTISPECIES: SMI1/KNR4 family protein [unclassified Burkholderia]MBP0610844.1 SMI1/KNR4 family protein [Burkholderia sp. CpTa8-5]MBP0717301.1 SMI1/KNR4 family protein [Burkholderia sp. AcTa6-5]